MIIGFPSFGNLFTPPVYSSRELRDMETHIRNTYGRTYELLLGGGIVWYSDLIKEAEAREAKEREDGA